VKLNGDSSGSRTVFGEGEQPSEQSDAGKLIVPESVRLRQRPSEGGNDRNQLDQSPEGAKVFRSEAEELRRGFGVQGKGAAAPLSPASLM
jgi:hypothetical protein